MEVSLVVKEETSVPPGTGVAALFEQLRSILGVDQPIEYQLDTPPMSPEPATKGTVSTRGGSLVFLAVSYPTLVFVVSAFSIIVCLAECMDNIKREPPDTAQTSASGGRCRACDRSMEAVLIQQTMSQLGLTPSDDEVCALLRQCVCSLHRFFILKHLLLEVGTHYKKLSCDVIVTSTKWAVS